MSRPPAVALAPQVWRIPTVGRDYVNSFAFTDDDGSVTLVDCGLAKAPPRIVAGLAAIGKRPADVTRILLTHVHPDHAGGAAEMSRQTGADVWVHEGDHPSATSGTVAQKADQRFLLGRLFSRLPDPRFEPFTPGPLLRDGEVLPVAGGLQVVHTPGHSPGHVSFFRLSDLSLIAGDAVTTTKQESMFSVMTQKQELNGPPAYFTIDWEKARRSVATLASLKPALVATGHGQPMRGDHIAGALADLARDFDRRAKPKHGRYVAVPAQTDESGVLTLPPPPRSSGLRWGALSGVAAAAFAGTWLYRRFGKRSQGV
jgi:glyoxylase-like metal-dependent hydrolase (beta-lactamase superfamily II)